LLSLQQEGLPGNGYFKVRGSGTMPDPLTRGPDLCVSLNQPVALEWPAIPQATSYHLRVFEADCPYGQNCDRDGQMASVDVAAQPSSPQSYDFVPQAVSNNNAIGFVMKVKSFGPDGIPGMESSSAWPPVMIQPTKPNALVPSGMAEFELDEPVTLSWNSEKSHWGGFVVNVYKGSNSNCQGAPQLSYVHMGASLGQNNSVLTNVQFDSGTHNHSWKVKPFVGGLNYQNQFHQSCALPRWSNCATFKVVENVPPLTAPTVPDGLFGAIGSVVALWSVVEGADHYKVEVRADSPNGAVLGNFDWGVPTLINYKNQLAQQWQVDLSVLNIWIANIPGAAPLNRYFYQVKACAGQTCGPPSNWSEWWETYPWPF
jgi:hypothetical protein